MQFHRRNLPHLQRDFTPHFITFVTKFRWILPPVARDIVLSSCRHDHGIRYELYVAVIMPDHVHLILTPLIDKEGSEIHSLVGIMRTIKSASSHRINWQLKREGAVWQEESFDHVLRSSESLDAKIDYALQNPVRRGLVSDWHEYRWIWQRKDQPTAEMQSHFDGYVAPDASSGVARDSTLPTVGVRRTARASK
jgi:REP element-mobilizing transposase RayT